MPLRSPNDTELVSAVLSAIQAIALPNTYQQQTGGSVFINDDSPLELGQATFPVLFIQEAEQQSSRMDWYTWKLEKLHVRLSQIQLWLSQPNTINSIWSASGLDLKRMQANLEDNPSLRLTNGAPDPNGTATALGILDFKLSTRIEDSLDERTYSFPVVKRWLDIELELKPYLSKG